MSRPIKFTAEAIAKALRETHGLVTLAARKVGCDPIVIYRAMKRYKIVQQAIDESREETLDFCESKVLTAINDGDVDAAKFYLRTIGKKRGFSERTEVTGAEGGPLTVIIKDEATDG